MLHIKLGLPGTQFSVHLISSSAGFGSTKMRMLRGAFTASGKVSVRTVHLSGFRRGGGKVRLRRGASVAASGGISCTEASSSTSTADRI